MSIIGLVSIIVLILIMILAVIIMFKQAPKGDFNKRILALTPIIVGVLFSLLIPESFLSMDKALSSFIKMVIPFIGAAFSLPLILKAKREMEKDKK
ncbi:hypothetical protein [Pseudogracilibacillus auburnensis]|uniref:hypothetical protein n=1 Tax=Pseudogracilibacillus auburnensis TaxID=1494959 RepID=UPI001A977C79|nr:hypothetical protein [Pseudogracilibacillus auburnensis]MBO1004539.1 hypothetical protein [Pseudogracilibacillus auburnensis]